MGCATSTIKFKGYPDGMNLLPQHPISVTDRKTASLLLAGQKEYNLPKCHHLSSIPLYHDSPGTDIENESVKRRVAVAATPRLSRDGY